ncbi:MAG TPA: dynamin family protein, partial [Nitriliruptorales bacterium]
MSTLRERVEGLCQQATDAGAGTSIVTEVQRARARLDHPLRVALAGKVKAGKSTLLNALVGERLAQTDAGECTRLVSWYREGLGYEVEAVLASGERRALPFSRDDGELAIDLGPLDLDDVAHLDVRWPSATLRRVTLIDTPGLASTNERASLRTIDFLAPDDAPGEADAVVYLMRHLHRHDADFLETFTDRSLTNASPVNAIAVLSRADEIGAGRPDAMATAERIAGRYRQDPRVRALASTVVPVAGLVAETGLTLREDEFALLRQLARVPAEEHDDLLLSADRFVEPERTGVLPELRRELLDRLGLYGVRIAIAAIAAGEVTSGPELARRLVELSGLPRLRDLLEGHFVARADALKARSVLAALRALVPALRLQDAGAAAS